MLSKKSKFSTYPDGVGTSWRTVDRRLVEIRQQNVHFREESVGERRRWDAQVAGTVIERAVSVPCESAVERGDVFVNMEDIRARKDAHGRFNHPGDLGMELIAERFWQHIEKRVRDVRR